MTKPVAHLTDPFGLIQDVQQIIPGQSLPWTRWMKVWGTTSLGGQHNNGKGGDTSGQGV